MDTPALYRKLIQIWANKFEKLIIFLKLSFSMESLLTILRFGALYVEWKANHAGVKGLNQIHSKKKKSYLKIKLSPIDTMNIDLYDLHGPILISLGWFYFESLYHKENLHKIWDITKFLLILLLENQSFNLSCLRVRGFIYRMKSDPWWGKRAQIMIFRTNGNLHKIREIT